MEMVFKGIPNLRISKRIRDDDQVDQLHNYVTVYLLIISGLIIGFKELTGQPLDCWVTWEKLMHYQSHINCYCWAHNLYRYPNPKNLTEMPKLVPVDGEGPRKTVTVEDDNIILNSYTWVTVIFLVQAVLFKIPDMLWFEFTSMSGTKIEQMVAMLKNSPLETRAARKANMDVVAEFLELWLKLNGRREDLLNGPKDVPVSCYEVSKRNRCLSSSYIVVKVVYLFNLLMQFLLLTAFLDFDFWRFGVQVLDPNDHAERKYFPSTALCYFEAIGQKEWVQCVLQMNMLVEKIFMIQWLWFFVLLPITAFNIARWISRIFHKGSALSFIRRYLKILIKEGDLDKTGRGSVRHFVCYFLGQDGVFVLRILAINTSSVALAELIECLWYRFQDHQNRSPKKDTWLCEADKTYVDTDKAKKKAIGVKVKGLNDDCLMNEPVTRPDTEGDSVYL